MNVNWLKDKSDINVDQLVGLYQKEWWSVGRRKSDVIIMIENTDIIFAGVDENYCLCAFARVLTDNIYKALIFDVIIRKDLRNLSLGKKLMYLIVRHELLKNVNSFELYCPDRMVPFYKKMGFQEGEAKLLFREL